MDNTLFLGNGIFRLKTECEKKIGCEGRDKSWGDLLSEISFAAQDAFNANLPMPVEYDRILASIERKRDALESYYAVDGRNDAWKRILAEDDLPCAVKRYIAGWFNERGYCPPEILGNVLKLQFDHVLTSNYDLRIENHLKQNPTVAPQLHGQVEHVHGSIEKSANLVIGQSDYLKSASDINSLFLRPESTSKANEDLTWPSLLLTSNIYILGFGFGLDEIDLWHLLHLRSIRLANKQESERNRIRFYNLYPSGGDSFKISNSAQYQLFSTYGVDVINVPVLNGDYEDAYRTAIDLIADHLPVASPHANE